LADPLLLIARDHRKLLVVDGQCSVSGGLCIGNEWVTDPAVCREGWRDTALAIEGPACQMLDQAFARAWRFAGGLPLEASVAVAQADGPPGQAGVQVIATEPGRERASRALDLMIGASAQRLWITDAYLAVSQRIYQAFQDAARDGVDVRLLLPGLSDLRIVQQLTRFGYRNLLRAGVRIWEWNGPMLHAKSMVSDGRRVRVGSSNLNPSSLLANWELDLLVDDDVILGQAMEEQFLRDLSQSSEVVLRARRQPASPGEPVRPSRWLAREAPAERRQATHVMSARERRRRALISAGGLIRGARAALFGPLGLILILVAILFSLFPRPMAWVAAGSSAIMGIALLVRAKGHRILT
jgi:phosphatidylserine/phosphatidylglycerophosphate/cardiolipin synthase-like enzyme